MVVSASTLHADWLDRFVVTDKGLINLNHAAPYTEQRECPFPHGLANTVAHEPCRLKRYPERAMKLVRADALLATRHQKDPLQPDIQLEVAGLENGADLDRERLAAVPALVDAKTGALALQFGGVPYHAAMGQTGPVDQSSDSTYSKAAASLWRYGTERAGHILISCCFLYDGKIVSVNNP